MSAPGLERGRVYGDGWCAMGDHPAALDRLMCPQHWRLVPRPLQRRVTNAYAKWLFGNLSLGDLREVQEEAIAAVRAKT